MTDDRKPAWVPLPSNADLHGCSLCGASVERSMKERHEKFHGLLDYLKGVVDAH